MTRYCQNPGLTGLTDSSVLSPVHKGSIQTSDFAALWAKALFPAHHSGLSVAGDPSEQPVPHGECPLLPTHLHGSIHIPQSPYLHTHPSLWPLTRECLVFHQIEGMESWIFIGWLINEGGNG